MLPDLEWDDEKTLVKDRSAVRAVPEPRHEGPERHRSGVVRVMDLRSTVVIPPAPGRPSIAEKLQEEARRARAASSDEQVRLRKVTVRATKEEIFRGAGAPSWDDETELMDDFARIRAEMLAEGPDLEPAAPALADTSLDEASLADGIALEASHERLCAVEVRPVVAVEEASAPHPRGMEEARKMMLGMPRAQLPPNLDEARHHLPAPPQPLVAQLHAQQVSGLPPVPGSGRHEGAIRRMRLAAVVSVLAALLLALLVAFVAR